MQAASKRVGMGAELKVGDLIIQQQSGSGSKASALKTVTQTLLAELVQQEVGESGGNDTTTTTSTADALLRLFQKYVVLPLPGYDVQYPPNLEAYYRELLVTTCFLCFRNSCRLCIYVVIFLLMSFLALCAVNGQ